MSQKRCVDKGLLSNIIRHHDVHNRVREERDMWRMHRTEGKRQRKRRHRYEKSRSYSNSPRMRTDAGDSESPSFFWTQQLMEIELNDPDRWGHSGYKDLYPEEFIAKLPVDEEQSDKRRKRKQGKSKSVKRKKKKKHKKKDKVKMIEVSNCEQKKLKTKNKKCMNKSDSSSDEDFDTEDTDSSEHKTKDRHLMSASQRSEMCLKEQDSGDSETSIDALRRKRQKTSHQEFGICDSGEEVRSNESKQYRKHRLSRARTKMDQQKKTRLKLPSDQIDRYSKERKAIKSD